MKFVIFLFVLVSFGFSKKQIALTFDDGPCTNGDTLLDALDAAGVKATFFLIGQNVAGNTAQITRAVTDGHEIGCHGWGYGSNPPASEITQGQVAVANAGGGTCKLFRAPNVDYGTVVDAARELGLPLIGAGCWADDWKSGDAILTTDQVVDNVVSRAYDGAIALMHWPNTAPMTAAGVGDIVSNLTALDYEFLTISELAAAKGVTLRAGVRYDSIFGCGGLSNSGCGGQFHCQWAGGECLDSCVGGPCVSCEYQKTCVADTECVWNGTDCEDRPSCAGQPCASCQTQKKCEEKPTECVWEATACKDVPKEPDSSRLSTAPRLFVMLMASMVAVSLAVLFV